MSHISKLDDGRARGRVFKFGDNVDTDVIIPARYLNITDMNELSAHCMEDIDETFMSRVMCGDIIVAGRNFGCGSSREHAPQVIRHAGVSLVIAESFARIFYRNAVNIGLPIVELPHASELINDGDEISADLRNGTLTLPDGTVEHFTPLPQFVLDIIDKGGVLYV